MSDARERLVARQREEYGESWDALVPEVGWTLGRVVESTIEDVLAEFDVTPRGVHNHDIDPACPERVVEGVGLRGECITGVTPTVRPSVEDAARAILMVTQAPNVDPDYAWSVQYPEVQDELLDQARAVLALLPGRTEAEVKWEYGVRWGDDDTVTFYGPLARAESRAAAPHGDKIVRRTKARAIPAGEWEEVDRG